MIYSAAFVSKRKSWEVEPGRLSNTFCLDTLFPVSCAVLLTDVEPKRHCSQGLFSPPGR